MATIPSGSRELRALARDFLCGAACDAVEEFQRDDLVTSLVRQWVTYDQKAMLLIGDHVLHLTVGYNPLGRTQLIVDSRRMVWDHFTRDWKIDPGDLGALTFELNLAQTAEVTNQDGVPLRIWVNPKDNSQGVEPLVREPKPAVPPARDLVKIATDGLEDKLGGTVSPEEMKTLAQSVAAQWRQSRGRGRRGHACIFLDANQQLALTLTELKDGGCDLSVKMEPINLRPMFDDLGFSPREVPRIIGRLNLGEEIEFSDKAGARSVMWYDPKTKSIRVGTMMP